MLHPQGCVFKTVKRMAEGTDFYFFDSHLEFFDGYLLPFFFEHVDSGGEKDVRKAVAQEVSEVTFVIFDSVLGHL